ncbi:MAG: 1,4-dihydroxy-2-naphthoate octaprenyltransferase [Bacteroidota bacterium]
MNTIKKWALATRLETGTLAITSVVMGSALAAFSGVFEWRIALLAASTAALLQLVCNLANDYGDWVRGADPINDMKLPSAIQTNLVTLEQVRRALWVLTILTLVSGLFLLYTAQLSWGELGNFLLLGALALIAAITYTMGHRPYGYRGWGDIAVFVFFGLVGVGGTFYLHTRQLSTFWVLPAISHGSLVVGVLNINNLRDIIPDAQAGKKTLAVQWGRKAIVRYHWFLLIISLAAALLFWVMLDLAFLACVAFLIISAYLLGCHGLVVSRATPEQLNKQLESLVGLIMLLTCLWVLLLTF